MIISHRGNLNGPEPLLENKPEFIDVAIDAGFDVEIDLRMAEDGNLFLGHDERQWPVSHNWIQNRKKKLLVHIKEVKVLDLILREKMDLHYFCHLGDPFTFTSHGLVWVHDLILPLSERCLIPLITYDQVSSWKHIQRIGGICSDFPIIVGQLISPLQHHLK